jgi:outer membrane protein assembly factor BamB
MTRPRRYLLIAGLLLVAVLIGLSWQLFQRWQPNFFDTEMVDAGELEKVKGATLTAPPPAGPDWPQYRGPNRDGVAAADRFNTDWTAKPPTVAWKSACGGGYGSVAVAGGRVYVQDRQGGNERLVCFNAADGKELWADTHPADYTGKLAGYADGPRATPTIHDGRAYTVGSFGQFRCVKLGDKPELLWEHDLPAEYGADLNSEPLRWGYSGSPLIEGDLVIVPAGGKDGSIAAFDRVSGEKRWAVGRTMGAYSSPVAGTFGGVRQVVAMTGDAVVGIGVPDGKLLWEFPWKTQYSVNAASPVIADQWVFVSSEYDKGCVLLRPEANGVARVFVKLGKNGLKTKHSTAVHHNKFVYGANGSRVGCMDLVKGELVADWDAPGIDTPTLTVVGDTLLAQDHRGGLFLIDADPTECRVRGQLKGVLTGVSWATPAVVGGRIYTRDAASVVCIDASK